MTETGDVLLRWARLKQEAKTAPSSEAASIGIKAAAPQAEPDAAKHEPFDAASLPPIDAIAADADIVAFLQSGVAAELTRAALRRAWTSDPAIRNFIASRKINGTLTTQTVGAMAAPSRASAEHSRSWRPIHFGLSK